MSTPMNTRPSVTLASQTSPSSDRASALGEHGRVSAARWWTPAVLCALLITGACDDQGAGDDGVAGTITTGGSTTQGPGDESDTLAPADDGSGGGDGNGSAGDDGNDDDDDGGQDDGQDGGQDGGQDDGQDDGSNDDGPVGTTGEGETSGDDTTTTGTSDLPPGVFLADDEDYIVFDIESVAGQNPPEPWVFAESGPCNNQADCEFVGDGYYQFKGANQCGQTQNHNQGVMEIEFEVKTAGLYRFAWRNLRDHTGGCENDRNNDSFVAFPTTLSDPHFREPFKVFGGGHGSYNWTNSYDIHNVGKERVCVEFEPGVHTLRLSGRSNNHAIDRIAIFRVEGDLEECRKNSYVNGLDDRPVTGQSQ